MLSYFHTNGGDDLFFEFWTPSSPGAIAGASIALLFLAMLERLVNAVRGRLDGYWASNALHRSAQHVVQDDDASTKKLETPSLSDGSRVVVPPRRRAVPPFIVAHDLPRGLVYMLQATINYALMLAVMTFQVGYFVAIIVGLGIGEATFGRWASVTYH